MTIRPRMVSALLRLYSYIAQALLSLFLLGIGSVAALSDNASMQTDLLPWSGQELRNWLIGLGLAGLVSVVLAFRGKIRILFLLWTLGITILLGRGALGSSYRFEGTEDFRWALILLGCCALTIFGAWSRFRQPIGR